MTETRVEDMKTKMDEERLLNGRRRMLRNTANVCLWGLLYSTQEDWEGMGQEWKFCHTEQVTWRLSRDGRMIMNHAGEEHIRKVGSDGDFPIAESV